MIPIFKTYMPQGLTAELESVLYSGNLAYGKIGKQFEQSITNYIGSKNVLTVSTYNQALLIILSTLGLKPGDEVIASPVSCLASNQPFAIKGLKVVWADVEPNTGAIDVEDVKSKISNKTKAIFHNHYCGFLGNINEINECLAIGQKWEDDERIILFVVLKPTFELSLDLIEHIKKRVLEVKKITLETEIRFIGEEFGP